MQLSVGDVQRDETGQPQHFCRKTARDGVIRQVQFVHKGEVAQGAGNSSIELAIIQGQIANVVGSERRREDASHTLPVFRARIRTEGEVPPVSVDIPVGTVCGLVQIVQSCVLIGGEGLGICEMKVKVQSRIQPGKNR